MIGPVVAASSDVAVGLAVGIPVVVVAAVTGVVVRLRRRGRGPSGTAPVPAGPPSVEAAPVEAAPVEAAPTSVEAAPVEAAPSSVEVAPVETVPVETVPVEAVPVEAAPVEAATFRGRMGKARGLLAGYLGSVRSRQRIDGATWDDLEEALIRADVGVGATDAVLDDLRARVKAGSIVGVEALLDALKADLVSALSAGSSGLHLPVGHPAGRDAPAASDGDEEPAVDVWLFVGVNGVGKTTTVGKVASRLTGEGIRVMLAAGDTFRAAAGEQLELWSQRSGADIVRGTEGGDPSAVVFDAVQRAAARGHDLVLADTAGRLHNKVNLIEELKKIRRVAGRAPGRVTEVLLVLDATTGQNGLAQAKVFLDAVEVTGVVLTKLDGTAKGGIVVAIQRELGLPVKLVGLGEGPDDLVDFDPPAFVDALF